MTTPSTSLMALIQRWKKQMGQSGKNNEETRVTLSKRHKAKTHHKEKKKKTARMNYTGHTQNRDRNQVLAESIHLLFY